MAQNVDAHTIRPPRALALPAGVAARWFRLGVGAVALASGVFFVVRLTAWPPHEDETLALFVGRDSLGGVVGHVTHDRGGAPLHFLLAWGVAHAGFGLAGLRLVSAAIALASLPAMAALGARLVDRRTALLGTTLAAPTWIFLFHGVFGRMYSLFLLTSTLAALALLRALDRGGGRRWTLWVLAILATVGTHPYGALVFVGQGLFVLLAHLGRLRAALVAFAAVLVVGVPFWLTDLVLASRFDVGVGGGGQQLGSSRTVASYLWHVAGDLSAGWTLGLVPILALALLGAVSVPRETLLLTASLILTPTVAFFGTRLGSTAAPQTRHLIFVLPLFSLLVAAGLLRAARRLPAVLVLAVVALVTAEVGWAWHRTPALVVGEARVRETARHEAGAWLARTARVDDVLFGYEPLFLGAWERDRAFPRTVVPRADATLALRVLRRTTPLGRGVFVIDGSDSRNARPTLGIALRAPSPGEAFVVRRFGPFLVVRTRHATRTPARFLALAESVQRLSRSLGIAHAGVNLDTVRQAERRLERSQRLDGP